MSKWIVDIHGDIEGDYEIIKEYEEPKTGHWIYDQTRDWDGECKYECSECGMGSDVDYDYCMRCGARMVEPQNKQPEISSYYGLKSYVRERSE